MLIISLTIIASLFYVLATSHVLSRLFHHQARAKSYYYTQYGRYFGAHAAFSKFGI